MLELPVAARGGDQVPAVSLDQLDYLTDLQRHRSLHPALPPLVVRCRRWAGRLVAGTLRDPCDSGADVGAAAGDGEDQALMAEDLDRPQYGVAANVMLL